MRWFVEKMYHFSHLKMGALDICHRNWREMAAEQGLGHQQPRQCEARSSGSGRGVPQGSNTQRRNAALQNISGERWGSWKRGWCRWAEAQDSSAPRGKRQWHQSYKPASSTATRFTKVGESAGFQAEGRARLLPRRVSERLPTGWDSPCTRSRGSSPGLRERQASRGRAPLARD